MDVENDNKSRNVITLFPVICIALLLIALFELPYGYYTFLRIVICLWGILYGISNYNLSRGNILNLLCFGIAILYNPIIKIYLEKSVWFGINICTAVAIAICSVNIAALQYKIKQKFNIAPENGIFESLIALIIVSIKRNKIEIILIAVIVCFILTAIYSETTEKNQKDTTLSITPDYSKLKSIQPETFPGMSDWVKEFDCKLQNKEIDAPQSPSNQTPFPTIDSRTDIKNKSHYPTLKWNCQKSNDPLIPKRINPTLKWNCENSDHPLIPKRIRFHTQDQPYGY